MLGEYNFLLESLDRAYGWKVRDALRLFTTLSRMGMDITYFCITSWFVILMSLSVVIASIAVWKWKRINMFHKLGIEYPDVGLESIVFAVVYVSTVFFAKTYGFI